MQRVEIIAEVGSTHDGSIGNALEMVRLWADCGADTVKFQDHRWQRVTGAHPNPRVTEQRRDYYNRTAFCDAEWDRIRAACDEHGVRLMVSPFSVQAAKEQGKRAHALKVASGEVTNLALLEAMRETGLPVYLSSGMSPRPEVQRAVAVLGSTPLVSSTGCRALACVMHCTSEYPCRPESVGLSWFRDEPDISAAIGFSDHTMGFAASLGAIALGATVIERHVTPSRELYGSDAAHSLEPDEFRRFVREVRELEQMLGDYDKDAAVRSPEIQRMRRVFMQGEQP